jgi:UDP-4-amino-4,6-dideoxy-N-acetyl-beta-L-altrosamine N-acetyltransferase
MNESDLDCVLAWRNHPSIRCHMITQHQISCQEHQHWFDQNSDNEDTRFLILEEENYRLGFIQFSGVAKGTSLNWGFYKAPDAPAGTGRKLGHAALHYAFEVLQSHKVCGEALETNKASVQFHKSLGFREEGVLREQHRIGDLYHDLICFGLLKTEWQPRR